MFTDNRGGHDYHDAVAAGVARLQAQEERLERYRLEVRRTFQAMSDEALRFQSARIVGGVDREEVDREIARRG